MEDRGVFPERRCEETSGASLARLVDWYTASRRVPRSVPQLILQFHAAPQPNHYEGDALPVMSNDERASQDGLDLALDRLGSDEGLDETDRDGDSEADSQSEARSSIHGGFNSCSPGRTTSIVRNSGVNSEAEDDAAETIRVARPPRRLRGTEWRSQDSLQLQPEQQSAIDSLRSLPEAHQLAELPDLWQGLLEEQRCKAALKRIFDDATARNLDRSLWENVQPKHQAKLRRSLDAPNTSLLELYAELGPAATSSLAIVEKICELLRMGCPWVFVMTGIRCYSQDHRAVGIKHVRSTEQLWRSLSSSQDEEHSWQAMLQAHSSSLAAVEACIALHRPRGLPVGSPSSPSYPSHREGGSSASTTPVKTHHSGRKKRKLSVGRNVGTSAFAQLATLGNELRNAPESGEPVVPDLVATRSQINQGSGTMSSGQAEPEEPVSGLIPPEEFLSYEFLEHLGIPAVHFAFSALGALSPRCCILSPRVIADDGPVPKILNEEWGFHNLVAPMRDSERRWIVGFMNHQTSEIEIFDPSGATLATDICANSLSSRSSCSRQPEAKIVSVLMDP